MCTEKVTMDISTGQAWKSFHGNLLFPILSLPESKLSECSEFNPQAFASCARMAWGFCPVTGVPILCPLMHRRAAKCPQRYPLCRLHAGLTLWLEVIA